MRLPKRSARGGRTMHPSIVPIERMTVASDAARVVSAALNPAFAARCVTDAGTYTDPAHKPTIDTRRYAELSSVRRRYSFENSSIKGRVADLAGRQRAGSRTPYRMNTTSSAGNP